MPVAPVETMREVQDDVAIIVEAVEVTAAMLVVATTAG